MAAPGISNSTLFFAPVAEGKLIRITDQSQMETKPSKCVKCYWHFGGVNKKW